MSAEQYDLGLKAASLSSFSTMVRDEEVGASRFVDARPTLEDGEPLTRVTFEELEPGQVPRAKPVFVELAKLPSGKTADWTGVVVVAGRNTAVHMFRESGDQ